MSYEMLLGFLFRGQMYATILMQDIKKRSFGVIK